MVNFIVVSFSSPYTAILDRPWIHAIGAISSTLHVKVKFHTNHGIAVVKGDQQVARQCLVAAVNWEIKEKESVNQDLSQQLQEPVEGQEVDNAEDLIKVSILPHKKQEFPSRGEYEARGSGEPVADVDIEFGHFCLESI